MSPHDPYKHLTKTIALFKTKPEKGADGLLDALEQLSMKDLFKFCQTLPDIVPMLVDPALDPYWQKVRTQFKPIPKDDFHFNLQTYVSDAEICLGYIYFSLGCKELNISLFQQALNYDSFHALYVITCVQLAELKSIPVADDVRFLKEQIDLTLFLDKTVPSFFRHTTPGFLLQSFAYFTQSTLCIKHQRTDIAKLTMMHALQLLHLARFDEHEAHEDIHNAYFNKGFPLSNCFCLNSTQEMLHTLIDHATNYLSKDDIKRSHENAKNIATTLKISSVPASRSIGFFNKEALLNVMQVIHSRATEALA